MKITMSISIGSIGSFEKILRNLNALSLPSDADICVENIPLAYFSNGFSVGRSPHAGVDRNPEQPVAPVASGKADAAPFSAVGAASASTARETAQDGAGAPPERDLYGTPYDARFHASRAGASGGKTREGAWRMRRGYDAELYEAWRKNL
jgi:hypothetical protein